LILLRKGVIIERGTYASAISGTSELSRLLSEFGKTTDDDSDEAGSGSEDTVVVPEVMEPKLEIDSIPDLRDRASKALMKRADLIPVDLQKRQTLKSLKASTKPKEKREQGSVKFDVYKNFLRANSYLGVGSFSFSALFSAGTNEFAMRQVALFILTIILQQLLTIGINLWLRYWAENNSAAGNNGDLKFYLGIYAALGIGASAVYLANGMILYSFCVIRSAKYMHDAMFFAVIRSPMLFFGERYLPPSLATALLRYDELNQKQHLWAPS
jgi:ATP-binding cassette subfamily C (CFTR/MRP) protein 1